jgi:hypothetical protein
MRRWWKGPWVYIFCQFLQCKLKVLSMVQLHDSFSLQGPNTVDTILIHDVFGRLFRDGRKQGRMLHCQITHGLAELHHRNVVHGGRLSQFRVHTNIGLLMGPLIYRKHWYNTSPKRTHAIGDPWLFQESDNHTCIFSRCWGSGSLSGSYLDPRQASLSRSTGLQNGLTMAYWGGQEEQE